MNESEEHIEYNHSDLGYALIHSMIKDLSTELEMSVTDDFEYKDETYQELIRDLPKCFKKSYENKKFMEDLYDRSLYLLESLECHQYAEPECIADEILLKMSLEVAKHTDTWFGIKKSLRKNIYLEAKIFVENMIIDGKFKYLYKKKTATKALADIDFIKNKKIKNNLHIDYWFVPFKELEATYE